MTIACYDPRHHEGPCFLPCEGCEEECDPRYQLEEEPLQVIQGVIPCYLVTLKTPEGTKFLEIPTGQGREAAERRAIFTAASAGWGDLDTITVAHSQEVPCSC